VLPDFAVAAAARSNLGFPKPDPLALLPVARSPSRPRYREPLVGSYPTVSPITGRIDLPAGLLSVAVVVT